MLEPPEEATLLPRIEQGRVWLWEDEHGEPVHLTAANPPAYGVARIGPVYTPREQRGRGYASAAVAEVSRLLLDDGLPGVPVHRPGQPDLEPDLRGARLPARRRHGEPGRHHTEDRLDDPAGEHVVDRGVDLLERVGRDQVVDVEVAGRVHPDQPRHHLQRVGVALDGRADDLAVLQQVDRVDGVLLGAEAERDQRAADAGATAAPA